MYKDKDELLFKEYKVKKIEEGIRLSEVGYSKDWFELTYEELEDLIENGKRCIKDLDHKDIGFEFSLFIAEIDEFSYFHDELDYLRDKVAEGINKLKLAINSRKFTEKAEIMDSGEKIIFKADGAIWEMSLLPLSGSGENLDDNKREVKRKKEEFLSMIKEAQSMEDIDAICQKIYHGWRPTIEVKEDLGEISLEAPSEVYKEEKLTEEEIEHLKKRYTDLCFYLEEKKYQPSGHNESLLKTRAESFDKARKKLLKQKSQIENCFKKNLIKIPKKIK